MCIQHADFSPFSLIFRFFLLNLHPILISNYKHKEIYDYED